MHRTGGRTESLARLRGIEERGREEGIGVGREPKVKGPGAEVHIGGVGTGATAERGTGKDVRLGLARVLPLNSLKLLPAFETLG